MDAANIGLLLSLRGGGASTRRKEARKRKYDGPAEPLAGTSPGKGESRTNETYKPPAAEPVANPGLSSTSEIDTVTAKMDTSNDNPAEQADEGDQSKAPEGKPHSSRSRHQRFVVFIGNLPYSATDASIQQHFASLKPTSIRHSRDKSNGKSKGFAFIEFRNYDHMKTCLEQFHQSPFEDGISPVRMLNVELTAGGGGSKSKDRRQKLKTKNDKLRQERKRRTMNVKKAQKKAARPHGGSHDQSDNQDVHPSRRARMIASPGKHLL
ncbi:MAG: hypothetical protein LQ343_001868 [Gyalolechia ehrenbergii]|nr:MAG: hypothetical protein LQ343_001868 [Gyalolechia ehrenbergii]